MELENNIELRIYRGASGSFDLYEDAGDGYGYENGDFSIIPLHWDEPSGTLTIGKRTGAFKGTDMPKQFHIVWVRPNKGAGVQAAAIPDFEVTYHGSAVHIHLPAGL